MRGRASSDRVTVASWHPHVRFGSHGRGIGGTVEKPSSSDVSLVPETSGIGAMSAPSSGRARASQSVITAPGRHFRQPQRLHWQLQFAPPGWKRHQQQILAGPSESWHLCGGIRSGSGRRGQMLQQSAVPAAPPTRFHQLSQPAASWACPSGSTHTHT